MPRSAFSYLLLNPPLTDPTAPYHSISYLVGAAVSAGFTRVKCVDANLEALNFAATEAQVVRLLQTAKDVRESLEEKRTLTREDELRYRVALLGVGMRGDMVLDAVNVFRNAESFHDYDQYREAVLVINRWLELLSLHGYPHQFDGFGLNMRSVVNYSSVADLEDSAVIARVVAPLEPYFGQELAKVVTGAAPGLVGISVNYTSQVPFAAHICRLVKAWLPECYVCVGGTEVTSEVKELRNPEAVWRIFPGCDAIVVGEGESAFVEILEALARGAQTPPPIQGVMARQRDRLVRPVPRYEDLARLPSPRYDIWDWNAYWSPEPVVYYSPTRGCYWNKCTFCDYGLNSDGPTSPSRERPIARALEDLAHVNEIGRALYFAVDAISPSYLRRLSEAVIAQGIEIRWSAEVRLEKSLAGDLAKRLKQAGCVSLSFGYESGSQRVLDRIDKGVDLAAVPAVLARLAAEDIGAQMMGFVGFPGETADEALETFAFLKNHWAGWTLSQIGDFVLTSGAMVAKQPAKYGISSLVSFEGDDIVRALLWQDEHGRLHIPGDARTPEVSTVAEEVRRTVDNRPFVGGIDAPHTILYFARNGRRLFPQARASRAQTRMLDCARLTTPFEVDGFAAPASLDALHREVRAGARSLRASDVLSWLGTTRTHTLRSERHVLEILPNGLFWLDTGEDDGRQDSSIRALVKRMLLERYGRAPAS